MARPPQRQDIEALGVEGEYYWHDDAGDCVGVGVGAGIEVGYGVGAAAACAVAGAAAGNGFGFGIGSVGVDAGAKIGPLVNKKIQELAVKWRRRKGTGLCSVEK